MAGGEIKSLAFSDGVTTTQATFNSPFGASGGVNLIINGSGEATLDQGRTNDVQDWVDSGTGTTSSIESTTTANIPLYPNKERGIKILNDGSGTAYTRVRFTMPEALKQWGNMPLTWYQKTISTYADDDFDVQIYTNASSDYTGAYTQVTFSHSGNADEPIKAYDGKFMATFPVGTQDYWEMRIIRTAGSASTGLCLNEVRIGPDPIFYAPISTDAQKWDATGPISASTTAPTNGYAGDRSFWKRDGSDLVFWAHEYFTNATKGSGNYIFRLPVVDGVQLTYDSNQVSTSAASIAEGICYLNLSTTVALKVYLVSGVLYIYYSDAATDLTNFSSSVVSNSTYLRLHGRIPISQWAGEAQHNIGRNDVEYAYTTGTWDAASSTTGYGAGGVQFGGALTAARTKTITWQTPILPTDVIELQASDDGETWHPANGCLIGGTTPIVLLTSSTGSGNTSSGFLLDYVSSTQTAVIFRRYAQIGSDDSVLSNWPSTGYWRLVKHRSGINTNYGNATLNRAGLIPAYETGTWSPSETSKSNLTGTSAFGTATYTVIGDTVFARIEDITGLTTTSDATRTYVVVSSTGLPSTTNSTQYYGGGYAKNSGSEVAITCVQSSGANTDIAFIWKSDGTGSASIQALYFQYKI